MAIAWGQDNTDPGSEGRGWRVGINAAGAVALFVYAGSDAWGAGFDDDRWHHCVITFPSGGDCGDSIVYVDGVSYGTGANGRAVNTLSDGDVHLGGDVLAAATFHWIGDLADWRIYDRTLTASEAYQLYAPSTRWDLYEPIQRVFPVSLLEEAAVVGPFPTFL